MDNMERLFKKVFGKKPIRGELVAKLSPAEQAEREIMVATIEKVKHDLDMLELVNSKWWLEIKQKYNLKKLDCVGLEYDGGEIYKTELE